MRDVSKILTDADLVKLRAILNQTTVEPIEPGAFQEYPKMLFHPDWVMCYRLIKSNVDPLIVKEAKEKLRFVQVIVADFEAEEEYLLDGWKADPADLIVALGEPDPRIPVGRESRRAKADLERDRARELQQIRRRFAELTGQRLSDETFEEVSAVDSAPAAAPTSDKPEATHSNAPGRVATTPAQSRRQPVQTSKAQQVRQNAARSARPSARA